MCNIRKNVFIFCFPHARKSVKHVFISPNRGAVILHWPKQTVHEAGCAVWCTEGGCAAGVPQCSVYRQAQRHPEYQKRGCFHILLVHHNRRCQRLGKASFIGLHWTLLLLHSSLPGRTCENKLLYTTLFFHLQVSHLFSFIISKWY